MEARATRSRTGPTTSVPPESRHSQDWKVGQERRSLRTLQTQLQEWKLAALDASAESWVFPSENPRTPLSKDNVWRRNIKPLLESLGLEWANFHVMRRTHSNRMKELGVDPKLVADQHGHTLDVNLNVYTATSVALRKKAVDKLENKLFAA